MGSAYKNKGVQRLLDGVNAYLPAPDEVDQRRLRPRHRRREPREDRHRGRPREAVRRPGVQAGGGPLRAAHLHPGVPRNLRKGEFIYNMRGNQKVKVGRLVRMHSDDMEDIEEASAGDIVALFGVDCHSGDTFTDGKVRVSMTNIHVPDAVIHYTITADSKFSQNLSKALAALLQGGPHLPRDVGPRDGRDHHQRHGRAAPRRVPRAHAPRVQGAGRVLAAARGLPRDHHDPGRPSTTPTRSRPVARASSAAWRARWSRSRKGTTSSSTRSWGARFRASTSRRSTRASSR